MLIWLGLLKLAFSNLKVHRLRSILTVLSMVFGSGAVIATLSSQAGAAKFIHAELEKLGTNVLTVATQDPQDEFLPEDLTLIKKYSPLFSGLSIVLNAPADVRFLKKVRNSLILGSSPEIFSTNHLALSKGRFFDAEDERIFSPVCIVGAQFKKKFFNNENPLGAYIQVFVGEAALTFQVIGVLREKGGQSGKETDHAVFIPSTVFKKVIPQREMHTSLVVSVFEDSKTEEAKLAIKRLLKNRFRSGLSIQDAREAIEKTRNIWNKQSLLGICLSLISLLTGGVGIMNIMLLSVTQRSKEIGLRKAVGANDLHILVQFLLEAVIVCFSGGVLGVLVGVLFGNQVAAMMGQWGSVISVQTVVLALFFAILTGLAFGLFPALRASQLDPYEALRG